MCRFPTILNEDNDDNNDDNHIYISILWKLQMPRFNEPQPERVTKNRITIRISILVFMVTIMMVKMIINDDNDNNDHDIYTSFGDNDNDNYDGNDDNSDNDDDNKNIFCTLRAQRPL